MQSQAVVFSAQALVCLSAKSWRFVSFGRSFNFQLLWKSPSLIPTEKRQVATLNGKNIWEFEIPFHLFAQGVSKCTPIFGLSLKNFYKNLSFHLFPLGRAKLSGVFEKFFVLQKIPSLIWTKGAEMHTHFWDFPRQIFYLPKISPHLFGITKPNDTLFHRKMRKYFSVAGALFCSPKKSPFTYSHWERSNAHPKSQKIFYPFTYLELRSRNAPCFYKNFEKYFFDWGPWFCLLKKSLHLFPLGRGKFQPCFKKFFAVCKTPSLIWN